MKQTFISARMIGADVGRAPLAEMDRRSWKPAETAVCVMSFDELATARERTEGAIEALLAAGFAPQQFRRAPMRTSYVPGAFDAANALFARENPARHWLICGMNDITVIGAVRALEAAGRADDGIAIGIGGIDCIGEWTQARPTAFFGSVLLTPKRHGYDTAVMMFRWITDGIAPPADTRTSGVLVTRENFRAVLREQGLEPPP